jgi:hypothetical protein
MDIEYKFTLNDLPQDLKDLVEFGIYTEEEAIEVHKRYLNRCKYCNDLDWLYEIVCYVPTENGGSVYIPVNYCPACGRKLDE